MEVYSEFQKLGIDCSLLSFAAREGNTPYFCTPKGAKIIGWAGVDGIHFCFVPGFDGMVFVVSPMNLPGEYVQPVAAGFQDFLALLLACGDTAAIEQARGWSREQFEAFLWENPTTAEQAVVLRSIEDQLGIQPMEDPYGYIRRIQADFDLLSVPFSDITECMPLPENKKEWNVTYSGGFWSHQGRTGKEIPIGKVSITWGKTACHIPAVYACGEGMVVDVCFRVEPERIRQFLERWMPQLENPRITDAVRAQIEAENPMNLDFHAQAILNGRVLRNDHGQGELWVPVDCLPEGIRVNSDARLVAEHYGLDLTQGWILRRISFPWETRRKPAIKSLTLKLEADPTVIRGMELIDPKPGQSCCFTHPVFGTEHTLTVEDIKAQTVQSSRDLLPPMGIPRHHSKLTYRLEPDLPDRRFSLRDTMQNDELRVDAGFTDNEAACIGIIGGEDGPTVIFITDGKEENAKLHTACSALHYEPTESVTWYMEFREKLLEDIYIPLI